MPPYTGTPGFVAVFGNTSPWPGVILIAGALVFIAAVAVSYRTGRECDRIGCHRTARWVDVDGMRACDKHVGEGWRRRR
jgi:hypothetical protein